MRAWLGPISLALLPLAVWPGIDRPLWTPKLVVAATCATALCVWPAPDGWRGVPRSAIVLALAWVGSFALAATLSDLPGSAPLLTGVLAPLLALAVLRHTTDVRPALAGQVVGASACAAVALLQWAGVDPFAALGWQPRIEGASVRMRVYGTLGNPNFVGVLMAMSLPIGAALRRVIDAAPWRRLLDAALLLQAVALVATGSRGAVLGLLAAMTTYAVLRWSRRVRLALGAIAGLGLVAVAVSPARPIDTTAAGRVHLWRIVASQALDAPIAGQGPGAVALRFAEWQRAAAREGVRDRRFAGRTDHVHNDYLEALVERGLPGLTAVVAPLVLLGVAVSRLPRPVPPPLAGCVAAVLAVAACATVDFPLARPTELTWWWMALVLALRETAPAASGGDGVMPFATGGTADDPARDP